MAWLKHLIDPKDRIRFEQGVFSARWIFADVGYDPEKAMIELGSQPLVYFLQHPLNEDWVKVGQSRQIAIRATQLGKDFGKQYGMSISLQFLAFALTDTPKRLETDIHRYFGKSWHIEGEWFQKRRVLYFFNQVKRHRIYDDWKR